MSSTVVVVSAVFLVVLFSCRLSFVEANYYYRPSSNTNSYHSRSNGHTYQGSLTPHHQHKHHGHHSRLPQAAVGVVNRGRLLPATPTLMTPAPTTLSPLDLLMSRLDAKQLHHDTRKQHQEHPSSKRHDAVPTTLLRSSTGKYAQMKDRNEDSYEDEEEEEDEDDEDMQDDGEGTRDEDEEDEEDEENAEEYDRRHQQRNHGRNNHRGTGREDTWYDRPVSDFPTQHHSSRRTDGAGSRFGGYSSYSEYKWHTLNKPNMDALRMSAAYKSTQSYREDMNRVNQHLRELNKMGSCKVPKPRVVQVRQVHPHSSKLYIPHCTILHRCSDDTGCCHSDTQSCIARKIEPVELFFYTMSNGANTVEKLVFHNHTECACADMSQEMMPRDRPFSSSDSLDRYGLRGYGRPEEASSKNSESSSCRCTAEFTARRGTDGSCMCECFDKERNCIRLKRGKDYLSHDDRTCVLRGECMSPSCEFGTYLRRRGRCPRKREKFDEWKHHVLHDEEYK